MLFLACVAGNDGSDDAGKDKVNPDDSASPDTLVHALEVSLATIPTVLHVSWTTDAASTGTVTARFGEEEVRVSDATLTTDHRVTVTGLPPITEVDVSVAVDGSPERARADITTGPSPAWVPEFVYAPDVPEQSEGGFTLVPVLLGITGAEIEGGGVVALDRLGRVVWAWPADDAGDPGVPVRARLALDGTSVLYNHSAASVDAPADIVRVALDGGRTDVVEITGGLTDFTEYTPGGYLMLGRDLRLFGDRKILGNTVIEVTPEGEQRTVWSVFDALEPDLSRGYTRSDPWDPTVEDWSHVNGISYDPANEAIYVTVTVNNSVMRIDRATGLQEWTLADEEGDFHTADEHPLLDHPHSVETIRGGLVVFNRGDPLDPTACSEALDITIDFEAGIAQRGWAYEDPGCLLTTFLGSAQRLAGGNTVVTWSTSGQVDEVTPDGEIAWRINAPLGAGIGFTRRVPFLGPDPG